MRSRFLGSVVILVASAASSASAAGSLDRARLKNAAQLPSVAPRGWYYVVGSDGRTFEGGEEPWRLDATALRARLKGDDTDATRWTDLAAAYRRSSSAALEKEAIANAVAILRRQSAAQPDDGNLLASLGLALVASGDDPGAAEVIQRAQRASLSPWAGIAASADRLVMRTLGHVAERRFATLDDARGWVTTNESAAARIDTGALDAASKLYDSAIAAVEASGATGAPAASVYERRCRLSGIREVRERNSAGAWSKERIEQAVGDKRKAVELMPSDPDAVTLIALEDAMSEPTPDGSRSVLPLDKLSEASRASLANHTSQLYRLANSSNADTAARALQGIASIQWFVHLNAAGTEATLRKSIAKEPCVQQSWNALVIVLSQSRRWDDIAKLCREWIKTGPTAVNHMMLAKALAVAGHAAQAEEEWRAAHALDPTGVKSNLGLAVLVIKRAKDDADLRQAAEYLHAASAALAASGLPDPEGMALRDVADAVILALSGDIDGCEKAARRVLARSSQDPTALEVLAAIGR